MKQTILWVFWTFLNNDFCGGEFSLKFEFFLKMIILSQIFCFVKINSPKIAYNMIKCLGISTFIFWILPNLAKYIFMDDHHFSNITKLERKTLFLNHEVRRLEGFYA